MATIDTLYMLGDIIFGRGHLVGDVVAGHAHTGVQFGLKIHIYKYRADLADRPETLDSIEMRKSAPLPHGLMGVIRYCPALEKCCFAAAPENNLLCGGAHGE